MPAEAASPEPIDLDKRFIMWLSAAVKSTKGDIVEVVFAALSQGPHRAFIIGNPGIMRERTTRLLDILIDTESPGLMSRLTGYMNVSLETLMGFDANVELLMHQNDVMMAYLLDDLDKVARYGSMGKEEHVLFMRNIFTLFHLMDDILFKATMKKALDSQERDSLFTKAVLENLQEGIMVEDVNCQMTYVNQRMAEMLGYSPADLIGKHWKMTVKDDELWRVARESSGRDKGQGGKYLVNLKRKDGSPLPALITATPLIDGKDFKGVISLATDVSRLVALEHELTVSKMELEKMNTELKRFNVRLAEDNIRLRKMMDITPEMEAKVAHGGGKYHIEPAHIYMIRTDSSVSSYIIFSDLVKHGMEGLCITRDMPLDVKKAYELEKTPVIWLTTNRVDDVDSISPTNMVDLSSVILSFLEKASNGVVLLDGLEYLIAQNSFMATLNLVQLLRDKVMLSRSRVIIPLDQSVLEPKDLHMLTKEAVVFDVHEKDLEYFLAAPR